MFVSRQRFFFACTICISATVLPAFSAMPVNTVNDGAVIQGGTYYNNPGNKTTFINSHGGGLWLKSGANVRGLEMGLPGNLTNNGGTIHIYAPDQTVRLDGNIDVRSTHGQSGAPLGNGGNVFIDAAYLYQSGNIYANGINGGLVQFNIGSMTATNTARIEAKGLTGEGGLGGTIAINASGAVDLGRQTVLDTSGKVSGSIDTNIINIEGGLVNMEGTLKANGLDSRGGTIRIVSTDHSDLSQTQAALTKAVDSGVFTQTETDNLDNRLSMLVSNQDGDIVIAGAAAGSSQPAYLSANGARGTLSDRSANDPSDPDFRAGDGGTVILAARHDIVNDGWIQASGGSGDPSRADESDPNMFTGGGNGGTVSLNARNDILNNGRIVTDGGEGGLSIDRGQGLPGGDAGVVTFSPGNEGNIVNNGVVRAIGGKGAAIFASGPDPLQGAGGSGGLVIFSSARNPEGTGTVVTYGGAAGGPGGIPGKLGTIVAADPVNATNIFQGVWNKASGEELVAHAENLILLKSQLPLDPGGVNNSSIATWMQYARPRTVQHPNWTGTGDEARLAAAEVIEKMQIKSIDKPAYNEVVARSNLSFGDKVNPYLFRNLIVSNNSYTGAEYTGAGYYRPYTLTEDGQTYQFTPTLSDSSFKTMTFVMGGLTHHGATLNGGKGGGRFAYVGEGLFELPNSSSNFPPAVLELNGSLSGGSLSVSGYGIQLGDGHIQLNGGLSGGSATFKADEYTLNNAIIQTNSPVMGGTQQYFAGKSLTNRHLIEANGGISGGVISIRANNNIYNTLIPQADPALNINHIQANGGPYGGFVHLKAGGNIQNDWVIEAEGSQQDGTVILE